MKAKLPDDEMRAFFSALAESVAEAPAQEILDEAAGTDDSSAVGEQVRALLMARVKQHRRERLDAARQTYERERSNQSAVLRKLPESAGERKRLLERVFAQIPSLGELLTVQHRDFKALDDEDITLILQQLENLGVLDKFRSSDR